MNNFFVHKTYVAHYKAAEHFYKLSTTSEEGKDYNLASTILFSIFALEAYLNHLGNVEREDWDIYDKREHPSIKDKLKELSRLQNHSIKFNQLPFNVIDELIQYRDSTVHARTLTEIKTNSQNNSKAAMLDLQTKLQKFSSRENTSRVLYSIKEIIEYFNSKSTQTQNKNALWSLGYGSYKLNY